MSCPVHDDDAQWSLWVGPNVEDWESILELDTVVGNYPAGSVIYMEGDRSDHLFYLERGRVKISMTTADGMEKILAIQEANTLFGESAAIDGGRYFCMATALDDSVVRLIRVERLADIIKHNPEIGIQLMTSLTHKLRLLALQVSFLSFLRVPQRLAHVLCGLADDVGIVTDGGIMLSVHLRHHELANIVGASRVTVTNILNEFKKQGLIDTEGRKIIVRDPDHLARM